MLPVLCLVALPTGIRSTNGISMVLVVAFFRELLF